MSNMTWAADSLMLGVILILSLSGAVIFTLAYLRVRTRRLLLLTITMLLFVAKAALLLAGSYIDALEFLGEGGYHFLFDLGVVAILILSGSWE